MYLFRKHPKPITPPQSKRYRAEVHTAAKDAQKKVAKLNTVMNNGITLKIYLAAGGKHHEH